ncbi:MAG: amidohydrolase, partial [Chloroflexi bacterium]|nr:amidohydrolase [Chloroflexota bacterium]
HTHVFPPWLQEQRDRWLERDATFGELYSNPRAKLATVDDLLTAMDEDGIDRAVVMGMGWTDKGLAREVNNYLIEAVRDHPDRLTGFAGLNPAWGDEAAKEADRCARAGLRGVGELHPDTQGFDLGDQRTMAPLMEAANEHGLIITTHSSEPAGHLYPGKGHTTPDVLWRFIQNAQNYPNVKIVCAHWGGGLPFYALMPEVKEALVNVYFDTAASPFLYTPQIFSTVERLVGAEHILFGSDYPLLRPKRLLAHLEESDLPDEIQQTIRTSGLRLLGL